MRFILTDCYREGVKTTVPREQLSWECETIHCNEVFITSRKNRVVFDRKGNHVVDGGTYEYMFTAKSSSGSN